MIIEIAIGDAYGAGFEYNTNAQPQNTLENYIKHPTHGLHAGQYSDDTQMSLAIVEAMLEDDEWTPLSLAQRFCDVFHRDQRPGYAQGFYDFLLEHKNGEEFLRDIRPDSDKSGGAMRTTPIGLYPDINEVIEKTKIQAAITHNTEDGIAAAVAASVATHFFAYDLGSPDEVGSFIKEFDNTKDWDTDWEGKVHSRGWMSTKAALTAVRRSDNLADLLKDCIAFTGDVDTVAAIAMGIASVSKYHEKNLPENLFHKLEHGTYGFTYLSNLDADLLNKFAI